MSENRKLLIRVARQLGLLRDELVFVGGATVELYFTDPASDRVRPTVDADAICEVTGYAEYHRLGERLRSLGFRQDVPDPIYRWRSGSDVLDVMPTDERVLGFSNRWYAPAIKAAQTVPLELDLSILIPPPPVFLAAKLAAHESRGLADPLTSQDLEDVVALLANRPELSHEVAAADQGLRAYISDRLSRCLPDDDRAEILSAFLPEVRLVPGLVEEVASRIQRLSG